VPNTVKLTIVRVYESMSNNTYARLARFARFARFAPRAAAICTLARLARLARLAHSALLRLLLRTARYAAEQLRMSQYVLRAKVLDVVHGAGHLDSPPLHGNTVGMLIYRRCLRSRSSALRIDLVFCVARRSLPLLSPRCARAARAFATRNSLASFAHCRARMTTSLLTAFQREKSRAEPLHSLHT
jgi:hypothetical protein